MGKKSISNFFEYIVGSALTEKLFRRKLNKSHKNLGSVFHGGKTSFAPTVSATLHPWAFREGAVQRKKLGSKETGLNCYKNWEELTTNGKVIIARMSWIKQTKKNFLILCQFWCTLENFERGSCTVCWEKVRERRSSRELTPELRRADVNRKGPNFFTRAAWSKEPAAAIQSREASIAYSSGPSKKK